MKTTTRLLLIACLSMPLLAACNKQEEKAEAVAGPPPVRAPFSPQSFGDVASYPHIRVELTNPIDWDAPAGNAVGQRAPIFTQVRTTVFVEMRPADTTLPADTSAVGRGRLVVGPYLP